MAGSGEDSLSGVQRESAPGPQGSPKYQAYVQAAMRGELDRESGGQPELDPLDLDEPPGPEYMGSFSQLSSVNPERPPTGEFSASPTLGAARREQARDRRADFRRGLRLMAGLFLIVAVAAFVAGMLVGSIMEAVQ